jgi:hypothetical protein
VLDSCRRLQQVAPPPLNAACQHLHCQRPDTVAAHKQAPPARRGQAATGAVTAALEGQVGVMDGADTSCCTDWVTDHGASNKCTYEAPCYYCTCVACVCVGGGVASMSQHAHTGGFHTDAQPPHRPAMYTKSTSHLHQCTTAVKQALWHHLLTHVLLMFACLTVRRRCCPHSLWLHQLWSWRASWRCDGSMSR